MKLDKFWVVRNPGPVSLIGDVCFKTDMNDFRDYCEGLRRSQYTLENHTLHTDAASALKDAEERLLARGV